MKILALLLTAFLFINCNVNDCGKIQSIKVALVEWGKSDPQKFLTIYSDLHYTYYSKDGIINQSKAYWENIFKKDKNYFSKLVEDNSKQNGQITKYSMLLFLNYEKCREDRFLFSKVFSNKDTNPNDLVSNILLIMNTRLY